MNQRQPQRRSADLRAVEGRPTHACYQEGEYWTFVYDGTVCRLRDAKGLHCVAYLLRRPGERFAAVDLVNIPSDGTDMGTGATPSNFGADAEEARVLVTKRIRGVVRKIEPHHPSLAHHLDTCIKTGAHCAYLPDPERPLRWRTSGPF